MKTAKEMLGVSKKNEIEPIVNEILDLAMNKALKGENSMKIRNHGFGHFKGYGFGRSTLSNPRRKTPKQLAVVERLNELGYETSFKIVESPVLNIWLEVSWD